MMKNLFFVIISCIFLNQTALASNANHISTTTTEVSELAREIKQLYTFALKKEVSMSTKRNIVCQYLPTRMQKYHKVSGIASMQQDLTAIAKDLGKIKSHLNIECVV